jgi:decaprenylphospho-beta-D-ribofuranose 2-oxidase
MRTRIANWGNYPFEETDERNFSLLRELKEKLLTADHGIARGNGRCYGDASLAPVVFSTLHFNKILGFDPEQGILDCESGLTLDSILEFIVPKGWFLPVTPGTKFITVGGAVASDVHGKNHHLDGCFSRHVVDMDIMNANGEIVRTSPTEHPELFHATAGGMGLTGVITRVKFRLKKIETSFIRQKKIKARNLDEIIELFEKYKDYTYSVAWIDCLKGGTGFGRSILMLGEHAAEKELPDKLRNNPLVLPVIRSMNFPFYLPSFILNRYTVAAFNFLFYNKMFSREVNNVIPYEPFFYPLDAITNWNRGYGRKGFLQYQFVIPMERKDGLVKILNRIRENGHASFLAVLKVFGEDNSFISFPMKGYTMAMDFPVSDSLFPFLDELDKMVLEYGGRIYLSKDARMKPSMFTAGYNNAGKFADIVRTYSKGRFSSSLSKRLQLPT